MCVYMDVLYIGMKYVCMYSISVIHLFRNSRQMSHFSSPTPPGPQFASCYSSAQPLQLFGRGPGQANYLLLFTQRGPRLAPRPRLALHAPRMSLRQICHMLKVMKQVRNGEAAATSSAAPAVR